MDSKNIWEEVLSKTDIINVISEYVSLSKQGKNFRACCPFHGEKTPSFMVSPEKGIFKCFGCGKSGNALKFIEYIKNISSLEALKILATKVNIDISSYLKIYENNSNLSQEEIWLLDINKTVNDYFQYQLITSKDKSLKEFIDKRNLNKKLIKEFEIGFASETLSVYSYLKQHGFNDFAITNSSLISHSNHDVNFFNNRLMFPIKNETGEIIAFSGRDITNKSSNKYLNSSETAIFKKAETFFNFYNAKPYINQTKEVYLVEGQFDCIALHKANFKNVIALMGTSFTKKHLLLLKNNKIILFFDNDEAGINATNKNLKIILSHAKEFNIEINFVINTLNKDPDELYNLDKGITLTKIINEKIDLVKYLENEYILKYKNSSLSIEKQNLIYQKMFEFIYYLNDVNQAFFKNKLLTNKILDENLYRTLEEKFKKPNFPSDPNFKNSQYNNNKKTKAYNNVNNENIPIIESPLWHENNVNLNWKSQEQMRNIIGRNLLSNLILKTILNQPTYLNKWKDEDFIKLPDDNEETLNIKKLICYTLKLDKSSISEVNLVTIIKKDQNLDNDTKNIYLNLLTKIGNFNKILTQEEFDRKINSITEDRAYEHKELLTK
ncbi:DNA primase [Metamycoplasma buccale]|uniref:DNA primase n=1 Tax=Metamycoplasma buccale TaxID=55602 RepID=UPI00398E8437